MENDAMKPSIARGLTILFSAGLFLSGCRKSAPSGEVGAAEPAGKPEAHHEEGVPETVRLSPAAISESGILTWPVKPVDLEHLLVLNGTVGHDENRLLVVAANVSGRVVSIPVDFGAPVRKGDPLVVVESAELGRAREDYLREISSLRVSERAYERARRLVEGKAISAGEFQSREGEYLSHRAAAEAAERALHLLGESNESVAALRAALESGGEPASVGAPRLTLRAPFAGRVIDRQVTPGSLFSAQQPLVTIADLSSVWVFLQVYEKDLALLKNGLAVTIRAEAYPRETFEGRIDFVGSVLEPANRTVRVRASVQNSLERLKPGMFVKAVVDVPKPAAEAKLVLAVPESALQTLEGRTTVFVESSAGVFERRFVEIGHSFEGFTEILSGVRPGDAVVTEGSFILKSEFAKATLAEEH
jgi:cobalt-zinc-cadmium efflux system membrane fusion protein